jgi:hypothetical protein
MASTAANFGVIGAHCGPFVGDGHDRCRGLPVEVRAAPFSAQAAPRRPGRRLGNDRQTHKAEPLKGFLAGSHAGQRQGWPRRPLARDRPPPLGTRRARHQATPPLTHPRKNWPPTKSPPALHAPRTPDLEAQAGRTRSSLKHGNLSEGWGRHFSPRRRGDTEDSAAKASGLTEAGPVHQTPEGLSGSAFRASSNEARAYRRIVSGRFCESD